MEEFQLEGGGGKAVPLWAEWAAMYGSSERTLKRWVAHGREKGEECPLGDARQLADWWVRNMDHRVPAKILGAAKKLPASSIAPEPAESGEIPAPAAAAPTVFQPFSEAGSHEVGIGVTLKRLQDLEVYTYNIYREALAKAEDGKAATALKNYKELASEVVKTQDKALAHAEKMRELIPRVAAEAAIAELHQDVLMRYRGMGETILRRFGIGVTAENLAVWQGLVDDLCIKLQEEVFAEA